MLIEINVVHQHGVPIIFEEVITFKLIQVKRDYNISLLRIFETNKSKSLKNFEKVACIAIDDLF